jgi:putative SOS response-associated peptidase YedK
MCGRFTYKLTWAEIAKLYRLTLDQPARNTQPRYNICPTTTIDTVVSSEGKACARLNAVGPDPLLME